MQINLAIDFLSIQKCAYLSPTLPHKKNCRNSHFRTHRIVLQHQKNTLITEQLYNCKYFKTIHNNLKNCFKSLQFLVLSNLETLVVKYPNIVYKHSLRENASVIRRAWPLPSNGHIKNKVKWRIVWVSGNGGIIFGVCEK